MLFPRNLSRALLAALPLLASCAGCLEQPARPVTLRVKNALSWPVYVRDEDGQLGAQLMQYDRGAWREMAESAGCSCQECSQACNASCNCSPAPTWARRIAPGESVERTWNGEYRSPDRASCFLAGAVDCLGDRVPAQPGSYRLKLCWASTLSAGTTDAQRFRAEFPQTLNCATRDFSLPAEGAVEVQTVEPPGCRTSGDCAAGELCLDGGCSATCLPNDVPALGGEWSVEVGSPDDAGFFNFAVSADTIRYRGAGRVAAVRYSAGTTNLTVVRTDASGIDYSASFYYVLPGKRAFPLSVGESIEVELVEYAAGGRKGARAVVLRQSGQLLVMADSGLGGRVLDDAASSPFSVSATGEPFACSVGDCGRRLYSRLSFSAGAVSQALSPGKAAALEVAGQSYEAAAVANYADEVRGCGVMPVMPHAVIWSRPAAP